MSKLKLEVGKSYRRNDGSVEKVLCIEPDEKVTINGLRLYRVSDGEDDFWFYDEEGKFDGRQSDTTYYRHLVEEVRVHDEPTSKDVIYFSKHDDPRSFPATGAIDFTADYPVAKLSSEDYLTFLRGLYDNMLELIEAKNRDYTNGGGAFANFEKSTEFGVDPLVGVMLRMEDKIQRIKSFVKTGSLAVKGEGVEEALQDVIGYASICLGMLEQDKREEK